MTNQDIFPSLRLRFGQEDNKTIKMDQVFGAGPRASDKFGLAARLKALKIFKEKISQKHNNLKKKIIRALEKELPHLDVSKQSSLMELLKSESIDMKNPDAAKIEKAAREEDKLAQALCYSHAEALGKFLASKIKDEKINPKLLSVSGSNIVPMLSGDDKFSRTCLKKFWAGYNSVAALNSFAITDEKEQKTRLILHKKDDCDGLVKWTLAKAALAKTQIAV